MPPVSDPNILIIEDNRRMSESIRMLLRMNGYDRVHTCINLNDAVKLISKRSYDLILLDLQLEDQIGFPVMDVLADRDLDTDVIIVTGEHSESYAITALRKGAADYLKKPFEPDELLKSIKETLGKRKDQSKKHRLEKTIVYSRERYRNAVDQQKDYLCTLDTDCQIIFINKAYAEYLGYTPQDLVGHPYENFIHESTFNLFSESLDAVKSSSTSIAVELQLSDSKGHISWQEWEYIGILSGDGLVSEIQCVGHDVTSKKLRTLQLEEEKDKFRSLAEITSDWLWEVDANGSYTYTNPIVYELLGYLPEEVLGKNPFDFMPEDEAERIGQVFRELKAEGKPLKAIENVNLHKNGSRVILETSGVPIFNDSGAVIGYRGIDRNISTRNLLKDRSSPASTKIDRLSNSKKDLSKICSICASCKMIRDDTGFWENFEKYFEDHFKFEFSHGICPKCARKLYPELYGESDLD